MNRSPLPNGNVTFLFTDIQGSTPLWERDPDGMRASLALHNDLLADAVFAHDGHWFKTVGDSFQVAFADPLQAIHAALAGQRALAQAEWGHTGPLKVRMGIHMGDAIPEESDYATTHTLNRVARIMSAAHGGQLILSREVFDEINNRWPDEITLRDMGKHRMKGMSHLEHLYQVVVPDLPAEFPRLSTLDISPNNLPIQLNKFIGREKEMQEVRDLLSISRLVTLTGSGGAGKTRLSLEVAESLQDAHPHGVWLVELAPQTDPAAVPQTVAIALGLEPSSEIPIETQLTNFLKKRTILLVFDNCEHLIQACAKLANTLLQQCPNLRILASSREALGVPGESFFRVPSLTVPDTETLEDLADFEAVEAVQLFTDRARSVKDSFALTVENAPTVAHICKRLDGIPLAIELAAARVKVMTVAQISERLDNRFRLLTGGSRTALPRQQTLRALIDWSYGLLTEPERTLLRRLSVFIDGWTLEAAEAVCASGEIEPYEVLDLLTNLVDKSLINTEETEIGIRYNRLETIRQYAREKFLDSDDVIPVRDAHLAYFMDLTEAAGKEIRGKNQVLWVKRLDADRENIHAAIIWAIDTNVPAGLRLVNGLEHYVFIRYDPSVGSRWLFGLLEKADDSIDPAVHAKALRTAMAFLWEFGNAEKKERYFNKSLALFKSVQDEVGAAYTMCHKAWTHVDRGELSEAKPIFHESLEVFERAGYTWGRVMVQNQLANMIYATSNPPLARQYAEKSLALVENTGDIDEETFTLELLASLAYNTGEDFDAALHYLERSNQLKHKLFDKIADNDYQKARIYLVRGDYELARACYLKSIQDAEEAGVVRHATWASTWLGRVEVQIGDLEKAYQKFVNSFAAFKKYDLKMGFILTAEGFSELAIALNQLEQAAVLIAWTDAKRIEIGDHRPVPEQKMMDKHWAEIEAKMDPRAIDEAKAAGEKMTYEEAVEYATREIKP